MTRDPSTVADFRVAATEGWTIDDATQTYLIDRWSSGYFSINKSGEVVAHPSGDPSKSIPLVDVLEEAKGEKLRTPLLIRFQDILRDRVQRLNRAFVDAIEEQAYAAPYRGVFPIKVNQLREVVEEIVDAGKPYHFGLEAGSKPELFAALAVHDDPESLIVCNGYKDRTFIRIALMGTKLGKKVILVAEKLSEVRAIAEIATEMGIAPWIGIRVRLQAKGSGIWATSAGEGAKFGLSVAEILSATRILADAGLADSLKLLHFHIGSQVPDILTIKRAAREASRVYAKMHRAGYKLEYLDVGGGLAVDYDGSRTTFHSSMNYSLEEYAADIVFNVKDICDEEGVPHPTLVSESGRAVVAHHSVLVVEAFGSIDRVPDERLQIDSDHKLVHQLREIGEEMSSRGLNETWHDVQQAREEAQKLFEVGLLDLEDRAAIEAAIWKLVRTIERAAETGSEGEDDVPEYLQDLRAELSYQHLCNFSVFQSLLDHWALGQLFPIMPLHRLTEQPEMRGTLADITCDSDGRIAKFIDIADVREDLPLHPVGDGPYYLGIFLTGAYQDIMGDIHNLFGRVNELHVFLDDEEEGGWYVEETIPGNRIAEVLQLTQYDLAFLQRTIKKLVDAAIKRGDLKPKEGMRLLGEYENGLTDQTYLTLPD